MRLFWMLQIKESRDLKETVSDGSRHEQFCTALRTELSERKDAPREQSLPPNQTA
jgi:hypothetical protein